MARINDEGVAKVKAELEQGVPLTLRNCYEVFGPEFYELLLYILMDATEAARAIAGAMNKLSGGQKVKMGKAR